MEPRISDPEVCEQQIELNLTGMKTGKEDGSIHSGKKERLTLEISLLRQYTILFTNSITLLELNFLTLLPTSCLAFLRQAAENCELPCNTEDLPEHCVERLV